jgi:hypothetical protein
MDFKITKNPILWFLCLPFLVIGLISFFITLSPRALYQISVDQHALEKKIESLSQEIDDLVKQPRTQAIQYQLNNLVDQLAWEKRILLHYKIDWAQPGAYKYYLFKTAGHAYFPFLYLMIFGVLFLAIAITWYRNVPFYLRAGSLSTGSLIVLISTAQWAFATMHAPMWYSKLTGMIVTPLLIIGFLWCWFVFVTYFYLPWSKEL